MNNTQASFPTRRSRLIMRRGRGCERVDDFALAHRRTAPVFRDVYNRFARFTLRGSGSEGVAQEVVVLPRDESQLAEENAIVLDHLVERLFAAHEVFELRRAEHGSQHGPAGDVDGLPGEALLGRHAALSHGGLRGDKLGEVRGHERVHLLEVRGAEEVLVGSAAEAHGDDGVDAAATLRQRFAPSLSVDDVMGRRHGLVKNSSGALLWWMLVFTSRRRELFFSSSSNNSTRSLDVIVVGRSKKPRKRVERPLPPPLQRT